MKDLLGIRDFSRRDMEDILVQIEKMIPYAKSGESPFHSPERIKTTCLFLEPSTRTIGSYEEAARILGFDSKIICGKEVTSLMKKESFANTVRMLAIQNAKVLVIRTPWDGAARFASEILAESGFHVSVQNGGDGTHQHPSQTFLDLVTIKQKLGRLNNFVIGGMGDLRYSRTFGPLLEALSLFGPVSAKLVSCPEASLSLRYKRCLANYNEGMNTRLLSDCDVVYMTRIQEERFTDLTELARVKGVFVVTKRVLDSWKPNVLVMHPQPYVDEIHPEIRQDPRLIIDIQAWYGIPTRMYFLAEGTRHRYDKANLLSTEKHIKSQVIKEIEVDQHLKAKREKGKYFRPIRSGTVIDHLPAYSAAKIESLLKKTEALSERKGAVILVEGVPSKRFNLKDVLAIENVFLSDQVMALVNLIAPEATFNIFKGGIQRKVEVGLPKVISGIGHCPNPSCITNHDPEAKSKFHIQSNANEIYMRCGYCEREFEKEEIISTS